EVSLTPRACPSCQGSGQVRSLRGRMVFTRRCGDCEGTGAIGRRPCGRCAGEGRVMRSEWLEVQIPAGVGDGSRVRIPGAGNAGRRGGPPGDFVLVVEVEPHPFYRREGEDLYCEVPVTMVEDDTSRDLLREFARRNPADPRRELSDGLPARRKVPS